jgi:hypothetical protein
VSSVEIEDRFGKPLVPRAWFLVPGFAMDEPAEPIKCGTIAGDPCYPTAAALVGTRSDGRANTPGLLC